MATYQNQEDMREQIEDFTVDAVMRGVHYVVTHDYLKLLAAIYSIKQFIQQKKQVFVA